MKILQKLLKTLKKSESSSTTDNNTNGGEIIYVRCKTLRIRKTGRVS